MLASSEPRSRILGRGAIDVSFEFFPPKTAAMEETLWRSIRRLEPLASQICVRHLWRGRLDARAHPRHGGAHPERDHA